MQVSDEPIIKEIIKEVVIHKLSEHSPLFNKIVQLYDAKEFIEQCIPDHSPSICAAGALAQFGATTAVETMSTALIATAPISPHPLINITVGTTGIIKAGDIGKAFGELTVRVIGYLIENVPSEVIDTSYPLILKNNQVSIEFNSQEMKFIKEIVRINQSVKNLELKCTNDSKEISSNFEQYRGQIQRNLVAFKEHTKEIEIKLESNIALLKTLQNINLLKPETLTEKLQRNYVNKVEQTKIHNNSNKSGSAEVIYDGDWTIKFNFSYSFGGSGNGGGLSCNIL